MKRYLFITAIILCATASHSLAQIGTNTSPDTNSILDLRNAANKGFLAPQVKLTQALSPSPVSVATNIKYGMWVYNTNADTTGNGLKGKGYYYWDSTGPGTGKWSVVYTSGTVTQSSGFWALTGNSATNSGTNFIGTTDNVSLRARTNNIERVVIDSMGNSGFGITAPLARIHADSSVLFGAAITGIGNRFYWNASTASLRAGRLSAGTYWDTDSSGAYSTGFGFDVRAKGNYSSAFGFGTIASAAGAFATGILDTAAGTNSAVFGNQNLASGGSSFATGSNNTVAGNYAIAAGSNHWVLSPNSAVIGGMSNTIDASANWAGIFASSNSRVTGNYGSIIGGNNNTAGFTSSVLGGYSNKITAGNGIIAGGYGNNITGVGAAGYYSGIFNGVGNTITAGRSAVLVGDTNTVSANNALVIGGIQSTASGFASTVLGSFVTAADAGTVVMADADRVAVVATNKPNQYTGIFSNGYRFLYNRADTSKGIFFNNDSLKLTGLAGIASRYVIAAPDGTLYTLPISSTIDNWQLLGNAGTDTTIHFLGTTNNKSLMFRINNTNAGFISRNNVGFGYSGLNITASGSDNTALGSYTLSNNIGFSNTAVGFMALNANTTGGANTAVGDYTLYLNQTGQGNTALGTTALSANTTGIYNTGIGFQALMGNSTGYKNVALGYGAGGGLVSGYNNIIIGSTYGGGTQIDVSATSANHEMNIGNTFFGTGVDTTIGVGKIGINTRTPLATFHVKGTARIDTLASGIVTDSIVTADANGNLHRRTTNDVVGSLGWLLAGNATTDTLSTFIGTTNNKSLLFRIDNTKSGIISKSNTSFGYQALQLGGNAYPTGGIENTAIGVGAMAATVGGNDNTAVGYGALNKNTASANVAVGGLALANTTTGQWNTAIGYLALIANITGAYNNAFGSSALHDNTTGIGNIAIGFNALLNNTQGVNNIAIGYSAGNAATTGSKNILIGSNGNTANAITTSAPGASNELNVGNTLFGTFIDSTLGVGRIGVNTRAPKVKLHVDSSVLFGIDTTGAGVKFYWSHKKGALSAGQLSATGATYWDFDSTGMNSVAMGFDTRAIGLYSVALGNSTIARGQGSFAMGSTDSAYGTYSAAIGFKNASYGAQAMSLGNNNTANPASSITLGDNNFTDGTGISSLAMGSKNYANGTNAVAIGNSDTTTANYAIAIGQLNKATAVSATAIGSQNTASAQNAIAMGNQNITSGNGGVSLGTVNNNAGTTGATAIGNRHIITNASASGIAIGNTDTVTANNAVALGLSNLTAAANSVVIGISNTILSGANDAIAIGALNTVAGTAVNSVSIGSYTNNQNTGATVLADASASQLIQSTANNQMTTMFNGGYRMLINRGDTTKGVFIDPTAKVGIGTSAPAATIDLRGSMAVNFSNVSGTYSVLASDYVLAVPTGAVNTINLPAASQCKGRILIIKTKGSTGSAVTINANGSDTFEGKAGGSTILLNSFSINNGTDVTLISDGVSVWYGN